MRLTSKTFIMALAMSSLLSFSSLAAPDTTLKESPVSLEQLQEQASETQNSTSQEINSLIDQASIKDDGRSSIDNIANMAKMDTESPEVTRIGGIMNSWGAKLIQFLGYVLSIGMGISIVIDLVYLSVAPLRNILAPGQGGQAAPQSGGFGGSSFGGGGFGSSYGGGSFGGSSPAPAQSSGSACIVSNEAIQAANMMNQAGPGGQAASPLKVWFKGRISTLVLAPTIFVLTATGLLARIGFFIGKFITSMVNFV